MEGNNGHQSHQVLRSGLGSWTVQLHEAGGKEMSIGQPDEGSMQILTGHSCKLHCSYQGMLPITNGSEIGKEVHGCTKDLLVSVRIYPSFINSISCPLHCSCAAPETSCLNNLLVAGQDRTCPSVLSGELINPLTEKHRHSKAVL